MKGVISMGESPQIILQQIKETAKILLENSNKNTSDVSKVNNK